MQKLFGLSQLGLAALIVVAILWLRGRKEESGFRVRESDLEEQRKRRAKATLSSGSKESLADAKMRSKRPQEILLLEGIRLDGTPHEILGVRSNATRTEIQQAYRELMKRFHPDKIGPPGSSQWKEAQEIAQAIIRAKETLLKPNR